jgi:hypothetical protein
MPGPLVAQLLEALNLPFDRRAELIGRLHAISATRAFAEFLIDLEEDRQLGLDFAQALKDLGAVRPQR